MSQKLVARLYWWSFRTLPLLTLLLVCSVNPTDGGA
jgi:hypothetical protein